MSEDTRGPVIVWPAGVNSLGVYRLRWLAKTRTIGLKALFLTGKNLENALGMIRGARGCRGQSIVWHSCVNWHDVLRWGWLVKKWSNRFNAWFLTGKYLNRELWGTIRGCQRVIYSVARWFELIQCNTLRMACENMNHWLMHDFIIKMSGNYLRNDKGVPEGQWHGGLSWNGFYGVLACENTNHWI